MNNHINYIEFKATDLELTKVFYKKVFNWKFTDYGENYVSFEDSGIAGGFEKTSEAIVNSVLVVIAHDDLETIEQRVKVAGGEISVPVFSFPGGRRFQFKDPSGNELAVWTEESED